MDLALDSSVVFALLFTFLALFLASIFIRRRGGGPGAAAAAPGDEGNRLPEGEGNRLPVEEVGAGEEAKEAAAEQREEAAEPSPAAPSIPSAAPSIPSESSIPSATPSIPSESSIPSAAPSIPSASSNAPAAPSIPPAAPSIPSASSVPSAAPSIPAPKEDAESKIPPLDASPESSLGHTGQAEGGCDHAELSSKAEEEDPDSENEKLVVREPEDEEATDETFSFKYSPGKLRGNQYKSMMTKEELEEEQRTEDYMKLSLASS